MTACLPSVQVQHLTAAMPRSVSDPALGLAVARLPYQDWRTIHPNAHALLDSNAAQTVAILGRGGLGKSVLLRDWLTARQASGDECLFLSSADVAGRILEDRSEVRACPEDA